jgi:hypothetical protein
MVSFIPAFRQYVQSVRVSSDQCVLFLPAPTLHLLLPVKGIVNTVTLFTVNQLNRQPPCGMFGADTAFVLGKTFLQIPGATGIEASVGAFQNVHVRHGGSLHVPFDSAQGTERARWLSGAEARWLNGINNHPVP